MIKTDYLIIAAVFFLVFTTGKLSAQERIEGTMDIMGEQKSYALYIPSTYDPEQPNAAILGLHPWNPTRWDAVAWRDTLAAFCESNELLLFCPDGGPDGQVDDTVDTLLASMLMDSVMQWYNIAPDQVYAIGFSWGARTLFTYALQHAERFAGFIPIGTAINSIQEINDNMANARNKPFYLIHGDGDNPSIRFYPVVDALENEMACVEYDLLAGVGHTIDFPDRNEILSEAYNWLVTFECGDVTSVAEPMQAAEDEPFFYPNPVQRGDIIYLDIPNDRSVRLQLYTINGKLLGTWENVSQIPTGNLEAGIYSISMWIDKKYHFGKCVIR